MLAIVIVTRHDDCSAGIHASASCGLADVFRCDQPFSLTQPGTYTNCGLAVGSPLTDPADYALALRSVKDEGRMVVTVIAGDPSSTITTAAIDGELDVVPSCELTPGGPHGARPANRLATFVAQMPFGMLTSACEADYTAALRDTVARAANAMAL